MTFHADSPEAGPALAAELLALVRCFAGAGVRLRFQKAGSTAYAWQVEVRDGDAWTVTHQGRNWLYNYFGTRHEVVLENVEAGAVAPAG